MQAKITRAPVVVRKRGKKFVGVEKSTGKKKFGPTTKAKAEASARIRNAAHSAKRKRQRRR